MQTQLAGVIAAILVVAVALFLTPLFEPLPEAILGAIVIVAVSSMFKAAELQRLWRVGRADFGLALIALAGVLVLDVLPGLLIAVVVSLAVVVWRASSAGLSRLALDGDAVVELEEAPGAIPVPGVLVLRLDGPLFFANADTLLANVLGAGGDGGRIHALVLDLEATVELDVPGADTIDTLGRELGGMGIELHLSRVHPETLAVLERTGATASVTGIHRRTLDAIRVAAANPPATGGND
jgi:SulP family sulfate permease